MRRERDVRGHELTSHQRTTSLAAFSTGKHDPFNLQIASQKIKAKPSERNEVIENDEDELMVRVRSGCLAAPEASYQNGRHEALPAYTPRGVCAA